MKKVSPPDAEEEIGSSSRCHATMAGGKGGDESTWMSQEVSKRLVSGL